MIVVVLPWKLPSQTIICASFSLIPFFSYAHFLHNFKAVSTASADFIKRAKAICEANNVLFIADEVQTGIARTGSLLAVCGNCTCEAKCEKQATYTQPDILILGKALSH
jgi:adenosylmethionine-8-amino-7-oxononanoate aminotransferase